MCENSSNTEFFLVLILPYLDMIQENRDQKKSVFGHFSRSEIADETPVKHLFNPFITLKKISIGYSGDAYSLPIRKSCDC